MIRYRFLDPEASADVIAQKLRQQGRPIAVEVHRTKRQARRESWDLRGIERGVRQMLADSEHFTAELLDHVRRDTDLDLLVPMPKQKHLRKKLQAIEPDLFTP